ncbi:MAG: NADPH-dependent 7-cyano-7-deazaguanine reductase QueF [Alphaproteobacteria bacterium GM202ARS2]|nr:NADPH-dependent 7-cyano-7-deazaguanine reductase QueF [Alphaproteobacteria bacterium GM202ARS2]
MSKLTSTLPATPDDAELEALPAPAHADKAVLRFSCPEFTTLCPRTGQPDFAHLVIDYNPKASILESKSLKLFLASFRNHADFHEATTLLVASRIEACIHPRWLRIGGYWFPRGGIPIDIFYQSSPPPPDLWIPPQGVSPYQPRTQTLS